MVRRAPLTLSLNERTVVTLSAYEVGLAWTRLEGKFCAESRLASFVAGVLPPSGREDHR
jgi:hypothetical protein